MIAPYIQCRHCRRIRLSNTFVHMPRQWTPDPDRRTELTLCPTCTRKLAAVATNHEPPTTNEKPI